MQSVRRQIKRGNAVLTINSVTRSLEFVQKRGTNRNVWNNAVKNRAEASEQTYMDNVTVPLSQKDIIESDQRFIFRAQSHEKPKKSKRKQQV